MWMISVFRPPLSGGGVPFSMCTAHSSFDFAVRGFFSGARALTGLRRYKTALESVPTRDQRKLVSKSVLFF